MFEKCGCNGMSHCSDHAKSKKFHKEMMLKKEQKEKFQNFINKKNIQCKGSFNKMKKVK